ncbi:tail fiber assembly protein, partial [Salmonella sp. SKLX061860]
RAVKLNIATDEEIKRLEAWELYSVMVNRVDTTNPDWPEKPASSRYRDNLIIHISQNHLLTR